MFLGMFARSYAVTVLRSYDKVVAAIKGIATGNAVVVRGNERAKASVWWDAKFNFSTEFPIAKHGSLLLVRDKGIREHSLYVETCVNI